MKHSQHLSLSQASSIAAAVEEVADFPKPGILFRNVMPLLGNRWLFREVIAALCSPYLAVGHRLQAVVGIESRGFIFGAAMAERLGTGFVPARKAEKRADGTYACKLPGELDFASYDLEYGSAALALQRGTFRPGDHVVVVDDLLATGGTAEAAGRLVTWQGAHVISYDFVIELAQLGGRGRLAGLDQNAGFHALLTY